MSIFDTPSKNTQFFNEEYSSPNSDVFTLYSSEITRYSSIAHTTLNHIQFAKEHNIISSSELNQAIIDIGDVYKKLSALQEFNSTTNNTEFEAKALNILQETNNLLAAIFKIHGTHNFTDLVTICLGTSFNNTLSEKCTMQQKLSLLRQYFHPTSYKIIQWKDQPSKSNSSDDEQNINHKILKRNRIIEDVAIMEHAKVLDCFDMARTSSCFYMRVHGIKLAIPVSSQKKTLIISGLVDDIHLNHINLPELIQLKQFFHNKIKDVFSESGPTKEDTNRFIDMLTLKQLLIYPQTDLWEKCIGYNTQAITQRSKPIGILVRDFVNADPYAKRTIILQLLMKADGPEFQYLAYLLFDALTNDNGDHVDTLEQCQLFDSLPLLCKTYFKSAMKKTIKYTNTLTNFDVNKIPLEQQICLMKAPDVVKEKAMQKLKEVKNKNEDSGNKARQYLEGLMKIPFGVYRREGILDIMQNIRSEYNNLITCISKTAIKDWLLENITVKNSYTSMEINRNLKTIVSNYFNDTLVKMKWIIIDVIHTASASDDKEHIMAIRNTLNSYNKKSKLKIRKILCTFKSIDEIADGCMEFLDNSILTTNDMLRIGTNLGMGKMENGEEILINLKGLVDDINEKIDLVNKYMNDTNSTLHKAVHGHSKAKRQIERIIGQWVNGEQTGYCFGFEGPPGLGKTSIAKKGIANCLINHDGEARPFSFIAIGGASNGSTLEGHNYTYVASTWGKIVDILMNTKCMNPIFFIDELDKVSRTEHGREIIGILTHLIDPSQNDTFQDKYFNGIDIDLSNALFIFSYNDPELIDPILLDRIHRVKFNALTVDDKKIVVKDYIMQELLEKMGMTDMIVIPEDVIEFIIENYTNEPGVRKLKELLFEIVAEINLASLKQEGIIDMPYTLTIQDIESNYLKDRIKVRPYKINRKQPTVGIINGLYANSLGKGGVLPIEVEFVPVSGFLDLKLTGMQGDVMKESMSVAKTLAIQYARSATNNKAITQLIGANDDNHGYKEGIHIHVPEGATKKDGPSAGTAITLAIYSKLTNKPILPYVAITGEICLSGHVTAIGGLEYKVIGGIKAGVKRFLYPEENQQDYEKICEDYKDKGILNGIEFIAISRIEEAIKYAISE